MTMPLLGGSGGGERPQPKAPAVAELGLAAGSPRSVQAQEPDTNVQSEYKRQLLPGGLQACFGKASKSPSPPLAASHPWNDTWTQGMLQALAVPKNPLWTGSRHLPAPCQLWAQGQAGSSCHINPAQVLSSLFLPVRVRPHVASRSRLKEFEQGPASHWASVSRSVKPGGSGRRGGQKGLSQWNPEALALRGLPAGSLAQRSRL